jgi:hypothetical protein
VSEEFSRYQEQELIRRQQFDAELVAVFGVLVAHLADRGAIDLASLRGTIEQRAKMWLEESPIRPGPRAPERANLLNRILANMPALPAPLTAKMNRKCARWTASLWVH